MSPIDYLLLSAILLIAGASLLAPEHGRRVLRPATLITAVLAVAQFAMEGFYWQLLPGYLLILVAGALATRRSHRVSVGWRRRLSQAGIVALMAAAAVPWMMLLPVPRLPPPAGPYAVGSQTYRWIDPARAEEATADSTDRRNVIVQAWYPAAAGGTGRTIYIDGLGRLPARVSLLPRFLFRHFDRIDTHAAPQAPLAESRPWPVVLFLPGYGAPRAAYSGLVADLASRGYVVLAIDHPYEGAVTELADGRIATTVEHLLPGERNRIPFMQRRLAVRIGDVRFVLDQLARQGVLEPPLAGRLDLDHVAIAGHSFGGAAAALAMDGDDRLKAAANIDGTLYGSLSSRTGARPFLLVESDHDVTRHSQWYEDGNRAFFARFGGGWRYELKHANHYSFTDVFLFFAPPGRLAVEQVMGGGRGPVKTQRATTDLLAAFLQGPLTGKPGRIEAVVARYRDIVGGVYTSSSLSDRLDPRE